VAVSVLRADARCLPLPDASVDLIVTSPPFYALRSYTDGGVHYAAQIGSEPTWQQYIDSLIDCTREWVRVLKPEGNLFVELGDKYAGSRMDGSSDNGTGSSTLVGTPSIRDRTAAMGRAKATSGGIPAKCLMDLPHRYVIRCVDELGLIKRAEIPWHHVNGLPESVTDRVRRAHSMVFHLTRLPRYYAAVDEIREGYRGQDGGVGRPYAGRSDSRWSTLRGDYENPLGKLPGSVWSIPSQPLQVPAHLGVDHFAAFPMELPRRCIMGWSPPGVCTGCGQGRRPVVDREYGHDPSHANGRFAGESVLRLDQGQGDIHKGRYKPHEMPHGRARLEATITGYVCACPQPDAPTRPAIVLDPFSGTGTTLLVASALGRIGIGVDRSMDYARIAKWRTTDPGERAKALEVPKPPKQVDGQDALFEVPGA
jgi:hypothetical protein